MVELLSSYILENPQISADLGIFALYGGKGGMSEPKEEPPYSIFTIERNINQKLDRSQSKG